MGSWGGWNNSIHCANTFPGKEPACQCKRHKRQGLDTWVGKIPWRRAWKPIPVFLPGESYGQRSLVGYSPWGHRELATTKEFSMHTYANTNSFMVTTAFTLFYLKKTISGRLSNFFKFIWVELEFELGWGQLQPGHLTSHPMILTTAPSYQALIL